MTCQRLVADPGNDPRSPITLCKLKANIISNIPFFPTTPETKSSLFSWIQLSAFLHYSPFQHSTRRKQALWRSCSPSNLVLLARSNFSLCQFLRKQEKAIIYARAFFTAPSEPLQKVLWLAQALPCNLHLKGDILDILM